MRSGAQASTTWFVRLGGVIPIVFVATLVVCGLRLGDYDHLSRQVSELGAIGTPTRLLFSVGLVSCSLLSVFFVFGLVRSCRALHVSILPAVLILAFTVSIGGAGLFPLPLRLHLILGMPAVLLVLSPLLALLLWRNVPQFRGMRPVSLLSLLVMALGFLTYFPELWGAYPGLKQRFFHAGWVIWFSYLSFRFSTLRLSEELREP